VFEVQNGDYRSIRVWTYRPPHALFATEEAKVIHAFGMHLRQTTDKGVPRTKVAVAIPHGILVGMVPVRTTDSYI
jgi:hypothetical protein